MQKQWFMLGVVLGWICSIPVWAQQALPAPQVDQQVRQQKSIYYTQIEYQRCRNDVVELLEKADVIEKRAKELEDDVRKLTEELTTVRSKVSEKPAN